MTGLSLVRQLRAVSGLTLIALTAAGAAACGGSYAGPTQARLIEDAAAKLRGKWVLVGYQPRHADPMTARILQTQIGGLEATFDGERLTANGSGLQVERLYRITAVEGDRITLELIDLDGVAYVVVGEFQGSQIDFDARTEPWAGRGVLQRVP